MEHKVRILLVGGGGREHALAWKLGQSPHVDHIFVAPGNGGLKSHLTNVSRVDISVGAFQDLALFAIENKINLVVPGPEAPLIDGIERHFRKVGIPCFGPSPAAARLEGSKAFAKDFMRRHSIPTAEYQSFTEYNDAIQYLETVGHRVVIKASGIAAGKGVVLPETQADAAQTVKEVMVDKIFGDAGNEVVIEERLGGDEISILSFSDGYTIRSLPPAQDHKRVGDGDTGPNTGGMGCYAPADVITSAEREMIDKSIIQPTIDGMRADRTPFVGMLFTGIMMTPSGPKVLEYNVRFGDPETQTLLPILAPDTDLAVILIACTEHWLDSIRITLHTVYSVTVVMAARGYPGAYNKGDEIHVGIMEPDIYVFHAGTEQKADSLVSAGGRVISVTATASSIQQAVNRAYRAIQHISFKGMIFRSDIAHSALGRQNPRGARLTYAESGVSIDAGSALVQNIKSAVKSTQRPGAQADIGGFGGTFDLSEADWGDGTILVGAIDGVGTKLKIAQALDRHSSVGIDLVAMNVNDLVVQGAESLFFLDCFSCGQLDVENATQFVSGVAQGCKLAGCALIGGETAEMPGMYQAHEYDVVGAAVGAVKKGKILPRTESMQAGNAIIGLASSGLHSNGFSLVRRIVEKSGLTYASEAPWSPGRSVGDELLRPTTIYARTLLPFLQGDGILGLAHITGGGLVENVPRVLPDNLRAVIDTSAWHRPSIFSWMQRQGGVSDAECYRTWNMGIGMVLIVDETLENQLEQLSAFHVTSVIGRLEQRVSGPACVLVDQSSAVFI